MPNWCTTNYIARGDAKDIKAFANVINEMPNLLSNGKSSFSRLWLGNFYAAVKGISSSFASDLGHCSGYIEPVEGLLHCFDLIVIVYYVFNKFERITG